MSGTRLNSARWVRGIGRSASRVLVCVLLASTSWLVRPADALLAPPSPRAPLGDEGAYESPTAGEASEPLEGLREAPSAGEPSGPLPIQNLFSLSLGYLRFTPSYPEPLGGGEWELSVVESVGNDHAEVMLEARGERIPVDVEQLRELDREAGSPGIFRIDLEHYTTTLGVARGIGAHSRLDLAIPIVDIEGGGFDRAIEGFHDLFSLGQAGRKGVPRRQVSLFLRADRREIVIDGETGKALGDARISFSRAFGSSGERGRRFAVRGVAKLPTGDVDRLASSGSLDLGAQLFGSWSFERSSVHASVGVTWLGEHDLFGLGQQWVPAANVAWEWQLARGSDLVLQLSLADSPFGDLGLPELDEPLAEATIGYRYPFRAGSVFIGLTENLANFNNSSDVGLSVGLTRSFGRGFRPPLGRIRPD